MDFTNFSQRIKAAQQPVLEIRSDESDSGLVSRTDLRNEVLSKVQDTTEMHDWRLN